MSVARCIDRLRRRLRPSRPKPVILMYHRVADIDVDPWGLAVTPDHFDRHLEILRASRQPFSMSEFVVRAQRGTLPDDAVAVTFDDGYVDSLRQAKPRLEAAAIPATLFLATSFVGQATEYWWDALARCVLERSEALDGEVMLGDERWRLALAASGDPLGESSSWRAWDAPRTERQRLYLGLWQRLRQLPAAEREVAMSRIRAIAGAMPSHRESLPMTALEVGELAASGLVEVGGHTATHPVLPTLSPMGRRLEILEGKHACERLTNRTAVGFAYPHGAYDLDSQAAVQECGFQWACSTESRAVDPTSGKYALPRLPVLDWNASSFERALRSVCD